MISIIPLQAVPSQSFNVGLSNQACQLNIYQKSTGLFFDLLVANVPIVTGVICRNLTKLVRYLYLGFIGDLAFIDTQGSTDPYYTGLGSRYLLAYVPPATAASSGASQSGSSPSPPTPSPTIPYFVKAVGTFTLTPNASQTVVTASACDVGSVIIPEPLTADAANDAATTSIVAGSGQFMVNHANNSRTDRTFRYVVIG
jgi:hypothetical protein